MKDENSTKSVEPAEDEARHPAVEEAGVEAAPARQAFMGHDFLRRNLLLLLPPVIKPVKRRVN